MGDDDEAADTAVPRAARLRTAALIVGGAVLLAVSLAFLVPSLVGAVSRADDVDALPTSEPGDNAFMESSVEQALALLDDYRRGSDPDVAEDLAQIAAVIKDQAEQIDELNAARAAPAPSDADGITIAVAIAGAITGAVAAAAGVVSAVGAVRRRRPDSVHVLGT
jgi:hypothetical protein